jgi:RNA polymerase sigma factor (sigma-70 family)
MYQRPHARLMLGEMTTCEGRIRLVRSRHLRRGEMRTAVSDVGQLVRDAAGGDQVAWDRLVARFNGLVWSVARAHRLDSADASDVVQTTWLRLVENLGRLQDPERVGAWLATTARRECLRTLRLSARQVPTETELLPDPGTDAPLAAALLASERDRALWDAFSGLSERCRMLLRILVADPPPSYEEVGAVLDMPIGSIGPTRARCLERLRRDESIVRLRAASVDWPEACRGADGSPAMPIGIHTS